ncbi:SpoIIE family protein phosphatase [Streptomyces sp. NPDC059175]|uniref:ATP-binding SpoIIE family protein phosphatase n=1 Tax=Streptomyces sp. NPDC059175 TaxID=3346757 RepID=UPI0036A3D971
MRAEDRDRAHTAMLDALFTQAPHGLWICDAELRVVRFNAEAPGVRGVRAADVLGRTIDELGISGTDEITSLAEHVLRTGEVVRDRLVRGRPLSDPTKEMVISLSVFRLHGDDGEILGVAAIADDVTERERALDRLGVLHEAHRSIGTSLDAFRTADELACVLVPRLADAVAVDLVDEVLRGRTVHPGPVTAASPMRRAAFRTTATEEAPVHTGEPSTYPFPTPYTQVLNDARPRVVSRLGADERWLAADPERLEALVSAGVHSLIVVPLALRGSVLGLASLYRFARPDPFQDDDLVLATEVVAKAAPHIDNARSYARERTIATSLQRGLMPGRPPVLSAVDTAYAYLPEGAGGDWYDVIPLSGARVALVVGDTAGRGIEAAATMGQLRTALRTLALQELEPDELLTRLDETASFLAATRSAGDPPEEDFLATCLCAVYDPVTRVCVAARAGHMPLMVLAPDGSATPFDIPAGPPLGSNGAGYASATVTLPESSLLALFTNGLVSTRGRDTEAASSRLQEILAQTDEDLDHLCDAAVYELMPSKPQDDAVLLLARTRALPADRVTTWTLPADGSVVATARRLVEHQLAAWNLPGSVFTTELIASELVTNAIRYGKGPIELRLILDRTLICEVSDTSSTSPHMRQAAPTDEGGRGLLIVMQLSDRWGTRTTATGKSVWAEQTLPDLVAPP